MTESRASRFIARIRADHAVDVANINKRFTDSIDSWWRCGFCADPIAYADYELIISTEYVSDANISWAIDRAVAEGIAVEKRGDVLSFFHKAIFEARKECGEHVDRLWHRHDVNRLFYGPNEQLQVFVWINGAWVAKHSS